MIMEISIEVIYMEKAKKEKSIEEALWESANKLRV